MTRRTPAVPPGLSTSERLVFGWLAAYATKSTGTPVDVAALAHCLCVPRDVTDAALSGLPSRQHVRQHADGRVVVLGVPESGL